MKLMYCVGLLGDVWEEKPLEIARKVWFKKDFFGVQIHFSEL